MWNTQAGIHVTVLALLSLSFACAATSHAPGKTCPVVAPPAQAVSPGAPAPVLESPTLRALQEALRRGEGSDAFWRDVEHRTTPLVETESIEPALEADQALVTFLFRGARQSVQLIGGPSVEHDALSRLDGSDVWFRSYRLSRRTRTSYQLAPDAASPDGTGDPDIYALIAAVRRDPLNPSFFPERSTDPQMMSSVLSLPDADPQPYWRARPQTPAGTVTPHQVHSKVLGNERTVYLYRPAGYRAGARENALAVMFDGEVYANELAATVTLDNLIAEGRLPPTAAILIANASPESRGEELPPNPRFAAFLADELMPWARRQGIAAPASRTVVLGSSYGGLAAAYEGLEHPEWFGNVYAQSGSFWWTPELGRSEPEALTRRFAESARRSVRFYLEAGELEGGGGPTDILNTTRHLRDVLRARGYDVQHQVHASGHDYVHWRGSLAVGLTTLLAALRKTAKPSD